MKKILFIPTYTYLSSPIFSNLLPKLKEYETLYLDIEDQYSSEKTFKNFKDKFSKSIKLHMNAKGITFIEKVIKFFKMLLYINRLKKLIKKESLSAIVTTGDMTFSMRIVKVYFPNIPVFLVQSALFPSKGMTRSVSQTIAYVFFNKILRVPIVSKQNYFGQEFNDVNLLLWGDYFANMLEKRDNCYIVGDLTLDNFPIDKNKEEKQKLLKNTKYSIDIPIVTICTSVLEGLVGKEIIDHAHTMYQELIIDRQDIYFIVKLHPRNNGQAMRQVFESLNVNNVIIADTDLHKLFSYTDIHISSFSRTAVEAIASNIPIVVVNPDNGIMLEDFFQNSLNEKVTNSKELNEKIQDILENKNEYLKFREKYIANKLYKLDGNAAQRATNIIQDKIRFVENTKVSSNENII